MPGGRLRVKPTPADYPASDEVSHLELHLQQQLQEDIARIFDESIYSDVEVVCGKLKILTHSCILKTRTNNFYRSLESILHLNIERNTFEEIYSFISDVYTECNIKQEENEIIAYLNKNFNKIKPYNSALKSKEKVVDQDLFLTPKCVRPYADKTLKSLASSPSTELTKEYYSIVPIKTGANIPDKELKEQDLLLTAFHSIIKSQPPELYKCPKSAKPTTLYSNFDKNKTLRNCTRCSNLEDYCPSNISKQEDNVKSSAIVTTYPEDTEYSITTSSTNIKGPSNKVSDPTYSPDSLIADDPSSSSDYLSAAYACSPGVSSSGCIFLLNAVENITNMENIFTSSDSGLENTGLLESITSQKHIALADLSLNMSTVHDLTIDDASNSHDSTMSTNSPPENHKISSTGAPLHTDTAESNFVCQNSSLIQKYKDSKSSKEVKQRQNEEILIMESSSLSSDTGSWESVFPPKLTEKDICEKFINNEKEFMNRDAPFASNNPKESDNSSGPSKTKEFIESFGSSLVHKSPFKSTSCFIDATLLIDDEDTSINIHVNENTAIETAIAPSQPVPISSNKLDLSPNDWSESNDNEDSLEQTDNREINHRDLSPTIFEMTPVTEDSLISNDFASVVQLDNPSTEINNLPQNLAETDIFLLPDTPHNSLRVLTPKSSGCGENCVGSNLPDAFKNENINIKSAKKTHELSSIISGGASVKDHLPQVSTFCPLTRRKLENIPIVSGAYTPNLDRGQSESPKPSNSAAWIIDVSNHKSSEPRNQNDTPSQKTSAGNVNTEHCNRSRTSVDSDGSEKSSHKFYIDFSNLSASTPVVKQNTENPAEKKYIFSMFIDLSNKPQVKEMPALQSSSTNTKRSSTNDTKKLKSGNCFKGNNDMTETDTKLSVSPKINNNDAHDFEKYECLCEDPNMSITEIISLPKKVLVNLPKKATHVVEKSVVKDIKTCSRTAHDVKSENNEGNIRNRENPTCFHTSASKDAVASADYFAEQEELEEQQNNWNVAGTSGLCYEVSGRYSTASTIREESITDIDSTNEMDSGDIDFLFENNREPEPFVKLSDLDKPLNKPYSDMEKKDKAVDMRMTRSIPENNWAGQNHNAAPISLDVISSFHSENALSLNRLFPHLQNEISRSMPGSLSSRTRSPVRGPTSSSAGEGEDQVSDVSELSSMQSSLCRSVVGNSTPEDTGSSIINQCQSRLGQDLLRMFLEEIAPDVIVEVSGRRIKAHKCILSSRCQYFAGILSGGWVESAGNVIPLPPFAYNVVHFAMCHIYSGTSSIPESVSIVELATLADMLGLEGLKEAIMFALKSKYCHHFHRPCHVCVAGVLECFPLSSLCGLDDLYHRCLRWITKYFPKVWPTRAFAALPADLLERCFQQHVVDMTVETVADTVFGCGLAMMTLQMNIRGVDNVEVLVRRLINAAAQFAAPRLEAVLRAMEPLLLDVPTSVLRALDEFIEATIHRTPLEELCRAYAYLESVVRETQIQQNSKPDLISNGYQNETFLGEETYVHARANSWKIRCQYCLLDDALRLVNTQAFRELPMALQQKLRKLGCVTAPVMQARRCPLRNIRPAAPALNANQADIERMRASFVPYSPRPPTSFTAVVAARTHHEQRDPRNNTNKVPKVKTTKAQEERARFNMTKNAQTQSQTSTKSTRMFENAKPRYLEPKVAKQSEKKAAQGKLMPKIMSSSESSRNSSPIQAQGVRGGRGRRPMAGREQAMSQVSLATSSRPRTAEPSTDSLSESQNSNKYATFTKAKHTKGNIEPAPPQSSSVSSRSQQSIYNKARTATKIPVSMTMSKSKPVHTSSNSDSLKRSNSGTGAGKSAARPFSRSKPERKVPGSLMNATKSSSAKVVQRSAPKEKSIKSTNKQKKPSTSRQTNDTTSDIPAMGRSGTFLKDEPTFGHNLDIDN